MNLGIICMLLPSLLWLQDIGVNGEASISLNAEGASDHCPPGIVKLVCVGVGLPEIKWSYNNGNIIYSFSADDSQITIPLLGHSAFINASLTNVVPDPDDPRIANFTSTLAVDLEKLQSVVNIACGNIGFTDTITVLGMPDITNITANYQSTELSSVEVTWGKVETICSELLRYDLAVGSISKTINGTSCGESFCTAQLNTLGVLMVTDITLRASNGIGTSGTATYPLEQQSGSYFTPVITESSSCNATAQCVAGIGVKENATCSVQYTSDPTLMDLSDPVMSSLNTMFFVQVLTPNTEYSFVFCVIVDKSLTVNIYITETCDSTINEVNLATVVAVPISIVVTLSICASIICIVIIVIYRRRNKKLVEKNEKLEIKNETLELEKEKVERRLQTTEQKLAKKLAEEKAAKEHGRKKGGSLIMKQFRHREIRKLERQRDGMQQEKSRISERISKKPQAEVTEHVALEELSQVKGLRLKRMHSDPSDEQTTS